MEKLKNYKEYFMIGHVARGTELDNIDIRICKESAGLLSDASLPDKDMMELIDVSMKNIDHTADFRLPTEAKYFDELTTYSNEEEITKACAYANAMQLFPTAFHARNITDGTVFITNGIDAMACIEAALYRWDREISKIMEMAGIEVIPGSNIEVIREFYKKYKDAKHDAFAFCFPIHLKEDDNA